jgi:ABC-type multidrug transport system fused ATPase/permease subunit
MLIATMITAVLLNYAHGVIAAGNAVLGGTFFSLFEYLRRIGDSFYNFAALYGNVVRQAADVQSADTISGAAQVAQSMRVDDLPRNWQVLEISQLRFRYEDDKHRVHHLNDVALDLRKGTAIAIVGQSGSGKSTLLSLLRGLQVPEHVTVRCDGKPLAGELAHLTSHATLIPQDPEIFADSIRFNITFGLDASEHDILHAVKLARFEQVLARLPNGLDTNIAEKGVNLSGGEKQRLALARGIFFAKESDVLLMDEPTSSVDTLNEQIIYTNILLEYKEKCIVSSVHKLHLLPMFDRIYVFDDGQLAEQGTFDELVSLNATFAAMWKKYQATATNSETIVVRAERLPDSATLRTTAPGP